MEQFLEKAKVWASNKWQQLKDAIKCRLIPEAKQWWKFWSTQLVALGSVIIGFAPDIHNWLIYLMAQFSTLPKNVQQSFDDGIIQMVGLGVILLSIPAKMFKQSNVDKE